MGRSPHELLQVPPEGGGRGVTEGGGSSWSRCPHPHWLPCVTAAGKVPAPRTNLLIFDVIAQSLGKSDSGRQDLSKQEIFTFATSWPMKF